MKNFLNKEKGKIGILISEFREIGGVIILAIEEIRALQEMGLAAEIIVLMENNKYDYKSLTRGIPIRFVSREYPLLFRKYFKIPFFSFLSSYHLFSPFLLPHIKNVDYKLIIAHETYNCLSALTLCQKRGIPLKAFVWDPISYILPRVYKKRFLRILFIILLPLARYFDRMIVNKAQEVFVGSDLHKNFLENMGAKIKTKIIYPGCHTLKSLPKCRSDYLLALTKWDIGKNPIFLLEILRRLKDKKVKLIMAGNWVQDSVRENFINKAKEYNLTDRIRITGLIDDKQKTELLSSALVLVHPIIEAFGMMCLEAAACGCPSIIPRGSGVTNLFQEDVHGFFPKEGDLRAFVEIIDKLLANKELAYEIGRKSWEVAKKNTWLEHTKRLIN